MCLFSVRPCSKPCSSNSDPPGATLPAGFLFALVGGPPLPGRFAAMCRPPSLFACRLRGGSVLHFLFPGLISPGLIFLSSCARPEACGPSPSLLLVHIAFPVALCGPFLWRWGLHIRPPVLPSGGFWGRRGAFRVQAWPEAVRACSAWAGRFFAGAALIAPPGLPGGCVCLRQSRWGQNQGPANHFHGQRG